MTSIESLPADQRAVLELVLRRGQSYDEIARLLSIDRAGVRQRALAAFDALGPKTRVGADRRALITDYLLSALPGPVAGEVRDHLQSSASERAWARAVASELQGMSAEPLPEIPSNGRGPDAQSGRSKPARGPKAGSKAAATKPAAEVPVAAALSNGAPRERPGPRAGSRVGGALLLGIGAVVAIVLVLVLVVFNGDSARKHLPAAAHRSTTTSTHTTAGSTQIVSRIPLTAPSGGKSPLGLAEILKVQGQSGVAIAAQGLAPNHKKPLDYYAVWLYNSASSNHLAGFAPAVTSSGLLRVAGGLPKNASSYHSLLITLETTPTPKAPGKVVLEGSGKL